MATSLNVSWQLDGIEMNGTIERPTGDGPFPAVVLVAGSGPTDRDWCSPLIPGTNGSGRLFAESFAEAGIASIRYDKRASGPDAAQNAGRLLGKLSMRSHLDELAAAVQTLATHDFIDTSRIVGFGNSEGTLHVLHYAISEQDTPFAGLVLAAPPGRPIQELLLTQLAQQAKQVPHGDELMAKVKEAAWRYAAGRPMNPDPSLPLGVQQLLTSFEAPANLPFARELWVESACDSLTRVRVPTLVLIGHRDIQVDAELDGLPLQQAAVGMTNVSFRFPANANHVFKQDTRPPGQTGAPDTGYNAPDAHLDPEALDEILAWLLGLFNHDPGA